LLAALALAPAEIRAATDSDTKPATEAPAKAAEPAAATPAAAAPAETAPIAAEEAKPAKKPRVAAKPAEQPVQRSLFDMFRPAYLQRPAMTQQPATPSRSAAVNTGDSRSFMAAKAASSYSTSKNAIGFGLYRVIPRETVDFRERLAPGTIIVRQREKRLYYVLGDGKALRYAITVGREGAAWAGVSTVSDKREWPAWTPTPAILARQPDLPRHVDGGPGNPLGARALYLGQTMYRIHGTNEPWRIGEEASSGCIRLSNDDVIDLYNRVRLGATVIVQR
jgi:lipoprotein-anchoring transpeptidase ErfK/SrfK